MAVIQLPDLNVKTKKNGITPESDGFTEIKGSEYYKALEEFESGHEKGQLN